MMKRYTVLGRRQRFPIQSYLDRQGQQQPLAQAYSFVFTFHPNKGGVFYLNVHILEDLARQLLRREHLVEEDFIRLAGKAVEAWLREEAASSEPHFNGKDTVVLDSAWYPGGPSGEPLLLDKPYYFYVEVEGPAPTGPAWWLEDEKKVE